MRVLILAALAFATLVSTPASADTYTEANFTGGTFGGSANVQSPFSGNGFFPGQTFSGSFVYDNQLVPMAGSGFVNVFPSAFPDAANISLADQFSFNFGSLLFTAAGADLFGIQYNNGQFNGFAFVDEFAFQGRNFQLNIQGGSLSVVEVLNGAPTFNSLVNGYINIGDRSLTGRTSFVPTAVTGSVPEPSSWAMMLIGFGAIGFAMRRHGRVTAGHKVA